VASVDRSFRASEDWMAAGITFLITGALFWYSMSPSVTLEYSGEEVTGAVNLGVPGPPGYPVWAFLGWIWCHLVPFGDPAWRICLMSVFCGAMVVGILTLLMARSVLMLLWSVPWAEGLDGRGKQWIALAVGASTALAFAFNRVIWLWACVPEEQSFRALLMALTVFTFFSWTMRPERHGFLYATILVFGLGIADHQTNIVLGPPFIVGTACVGLQRLWASDQPGGRGLSVMKALQPFWETVVAVLLSLMVGFLFWAWLAGLAGRFVRWGAATGLAGILLLVVFASRGWLTWKRTLNCAGCFLLGCSFYLYLPVSASTNPPMNWGYTATRAGFLHHILRGQYEKVQIASPLSKEFCIQIGLFTRALLGEFSPRFNGEGDFLVGTWSAVFAFIPGVVLIKAWKRLRPPARSWLIFIWAAFWIASIGWVMVINPSLDKASQEMTSKFFIEARALYSMLVGYGIALGIAGLEARAARSPSTDFPA